MFGGDCNDEIDRIAAAIPPHGLNLALVDPFGATPLRFETLAKLARFERMDMLLNFPTGDLARNLRQYEERVTRFLGTDAWKKRVSGAKDVLKLLDVLRDQLLPFGYQKAKVCYEPLLKNKRKAPLYHFVLVAKHGLADKIWRSVTRIEGSGQRRLW